MFEATEAMSEFAVVEQGVRGAIRIGDLFLCAVLAVKTRFHADGFLPGFPEFAHDEISCKSCTFI